MVENLREWKGSTILRGKGSVVGEKGGVSEERLGVESGVWRQRVE